MTESTFALPEPPDGWVLTRLGDVSRVVGGGTPSSKDPDNFCGDGGHAWLTPADLSGFRGVFVSRGDRNLTERGLRDSSAKLMPRGAVLMSSRAPIGYVAIAANEISTNQGFKSFVCGDCAVPEYVYFWLKYIRPLLEDMGSGSTFAEISGSRAREIPIVLPPVLEQRLIADRVNKLLSLVNVTRDRLDRIPAILKRFRQAVLAAACSGQLTEDWRNSGGIGGEHGRQFIASVLDERRRHWEAGFLEGHSGKQSQDRGWKGKYKAPLAEPSTEGLPDIPDSWNWVALDALSTKVVDGVHRTPSYTTEGVPFVTVRNLTAGSGIDLAIGNRISRADHEKFIERADPQAGDLLISKDGTLGVVRAVRTEEQFSIFVSVALIKPVLRTMSDYLELALSAPQVQQRMVQTGSGMKHLHLRDLKQIPIPMPPPTEQLEIVRRAQRLMHLGEVLEQHVSGARAAVEALPQAVLSEAFRGELLGAETYIG